MREIMLATKYLETSFDEDTKILANKYLPTTENMTDKEWQEQMLEVKVITDTCKPEYFIDDNRERLYAYSPDMQIWTLNLFVELWNKIALKKYVQILPIEIISKLTSDQIEEFALNKFELKFKYKFVEDDAAAYSWINNIDSELSK